MVVVIVREVVVAVLWMFARAHRRLDGWAGSGTVGEIRWLATARPGLLVGSCIGGGR